MARKGWTATQFRQAIDACFADVDPALLPPFRGTARHTRRALQRQVARFHGVWFVLMRDITVTAATRGAGRVAERRGDMAQAGP